MALPTLESGSLRLRPFSVADAADVQRLAGDFAIADTTLNIPHPYEDGMAEQWIAGHPEAYEQGRLAAFAITDLVDGRLLGAISIKLDGDGAVGELGYWVGRPYWGQGVATAAADLVIDFAHPHQLLGQRRAQVDLATAEADAAAARDAHGAIVERVLGIARRLVRTR